MDDGLLENSRDDDADDDSAKDFELVGTTAGRCGESHGPVSQLRLADLGVCQLGAEERAIRKVKRA